jgi:hypothetical protein
VRNATQTRMDMLEALAPLLEGAHHQPNDPSGSGLVSGDASCGKLCSHRTRVMSGSNCVLGGALCALCSNDPSGSHDAPLFGLLPHHPSPPAIRRPKTHIWRLKSSSAISSASRCLLGPNALSGYLCSVNGVGNCFDRSFRLSTAFAGREDWRRPNVSSPERYSRRRFGPLHV